jgi:hypothetical protein
LSHISRPPPFWGSLGFWTQGFRLTRQALSLLEPLCELSLSLPLSSLLLSFFLSLFLSLYRFWFCIMLPRLVLYSWFSCLSLPRNKLQSEPPCPLFLNFFRQRFGVLLDFHNSFEAYPVFLKNPDLSNGTEVKPLVSFFLSYVKNY